LKKLERLINAGLGELPGLYQDTYINPLKRNLRAVWQRTRPTAEVLAGAVYNHTQSELRPALKSLLALISNIYRSFLDPERSARARIPQPEFWIPPLITFLTVLDLKRQHFAPFVLPPDEVRRLCGSQVGVVSFPSNYRDDPILCCASAAHEAGGHALLHAYPDMLRELKSSVRQKVGGNFADPKGQVPRTAKQFLGLLWQYWTEEAACDVYAVMNIGPVYGVALAIYLAALSERIRRELGRRRRDDPAPALPLSWPPPMSGITGVDYHPTAMLALYVVIGAIEGLYWKNQVRKRQYISAIETCIEVSLKIDAKIRIPHRKVTIAGWFEFRPGKWVQADGTKPIFRISRKQMFKIARKVGRHIATVRLKALNNNSIQELETWDDADEAIVDNIAGHFERKADPASMGDDSQLLAGAIRALLKDPVRYEEMNKRLLDSLLPSFERDPIWGQPSWHPAAGWTLWRTRRTRITSCVGKTGATTTLKK
jgi:hypothetical protein